MKLEWLGRNLWSGQLHLEQYLLALVEVEAPSPVFSKRLWGRTGKTVLARTCTRQHQLAPSFVIAPEHEQGEGA